MAAAILRRPTLVGFDMGGTLAVLRKGETMRTHTLRVYRTLGAKPEDLSAGKSRVEIPADVSDQEILNTIARMRLILEGAREAHRDRNVFWNAVNTNVLGELITNPDHRRSIFSYAERIHTAFLAREAFVVCSSTLEVVRDLRRAGVRTIITSNSTQAEAEELLGHLGLLEEFDEIVTSDRAGARKTEARFWQTALELAFPEGIPDDVRAVQVGNSLYSDGCAAQHGWETIVVDQERRYHPHTERVKLNDQFTPDHKVRVREDIRRGAIRFARGSRRLRDLLQQAHVLPKRN